MPITLQFQPTPYRPDLEGARGGLDPARQEDFALIQRIKEAISQGTVDEARYGDLVNKHPKAAADFSSAKVNADRTKSLQDITLRNFTPPQPPSSAQGPLRPDEARGSIAPQGFPAQFNRAQAVSEALQAGVLGPGANQLFDIAQGAAPALPVDKSRAEDITSAGFHKFPGQLKPTATFFNKKERVYQYKDVDGQVKDVPPGAVPFNEKEIMGPKQWSEHLSAMQRTITGSKRLAGYMKSVAGSPKGFELAAKRWLAKAKTFFGKDLTEGGLDILEQEGKLQGLLGRFREEIVGPGVMTEYDAKRVILALGGEPNVTRHPEIVRRLLSEILEGKIQEHNNVALPIYRNQVALGKQKAGFDTSELQVPEVFSKPITGQQSDPFEGFSLLSPEEQAEVRRLRGGN